MRRAFADTHFYLALLNSRDSQHESASAIARRDEYEQVVTTVWVLAELADGMSREHGRVRCAQYIAELRSHPRVLIIEAHAAPFWRGFDLYQSRRDKEWSLTDCISFLVMADEGLTEALTGDRHFEQAGFTALLAPR